MKHLKYLILSLLYFPTILFANNVTDIQELRETNLTASITLAQKLWQDSPQNIQFAEQLLLGYNDAKQYEKIIETVSSLFTDNIIEQSLKARILSLYLHAINELKNWQNIENIIDDAIRLASEIGETERAITILELLGEIELSQVHFQKAEQYFLQAIIISKAINSNTLAELYIDYGIALAQQGKLSDSLDIMAKSYHLYEAKNLSIPLKLLKAIGALSMYTKQYDKALEYTYKAINSLKPDSKHLASLYSNIGAIEAALKNYPLAIKALTKSVELHKLHNISSSSPLNNLGFAYSEVGEYRKALAILFESYDIAMSKNSPMQKATSCKNIAEIYVKLKDLNNAEIYFDKAYQHYSSHDSQIKKLELYEPMILNLEKLKKHLKALRLMREYKELSNSIESSEAKKELKNSQAAFNLERKEKELLNSKLNIVIQEKAILKLESEKSSLKNKQLIYTFIITIFVFIVLIVLVAYVIKVKAYKKVDLLSRTDELTGLLNRRALYEILHNELARIKRSEKTLCLLIIDIDLFKKVNDHFGHTCGDMVLQETSKLLSSSLREQDSIARWGGEEFLITLPETDESGGRVIAEKLRLAVEQQQITYQKQTFSITISIGIQVCETGKDVEFYIKSVDDALYKAKTSGRNCVIVAKPS